MEGENLLCPPPGRAGDGDNGADGERTYASVLIPLLASAETFGKGAIPLSRSCCVVKNVDDSVGLRGVG